MDWLLEEPIKSILIALVSALAGGGAIWGWMRSTRRRIHRRDMPAADNDRFNILVADMLHDDDGSERKHIIHALEHYPGLRTFEIGGIHAVKDLGDHAAQVAAAETKGRKVLEDKNGDILLWGEVAKHGDRRVLRLRFLGRGGEGGGPANPYALDKSFKLPAQFETDLASLIAAQAFAAIDPKSEQQEVYAVHRLRGVMERVSNLVLHDLAGLAPEAMAELRLAAANAAITLGEQVGDRGALNKAIGWCRKVEDTDAVNDRELKARAAVTQGSALRALGEHEESTATLEAAVEAYRRALEVYTRADLAYQWAGTLNNLGNALRSLGEREKGTARLEEAVTAYRSGLEIFSQDDLPLGWAMTQNNLGNALRSLGEREEGTLRLEEAVTAYRSGLEVYTRDDLPLDWAMTQNNLGTALSTLGAREEGTARLEAAIYAFRKALEVYTRDDLPYLWAMTQCNLGNAQSRLGALQKGSARIEEAVEAFRSALEVQTRTDLPHDWAMTQNNLGNALTKLGIFQESTARFDDAVQAYHRALEVWGDSAPYFAGMAQRNLEIAEELIVLRS